ncbi:hypothetical protein EZJ55_13495 [Microcystis aeruginosa EAWAG127a]|uniref:Uncharacterized protein n=1 Tax=Microcystis aeruginosa EAWAG127a TaxID=2529855 RepID=A0A5J5LVA5_MICAE|nr:hypothetical protein [Microcystis aeruginosa]KAB0241428.1 hypothetical protein EZJ55_13495 [Microcystis aeruginosa EAWAG127a]
MAKTIKFNLILDGHPVRNLEGLRENFNLDDLLKYYENGVLIKWLTVRGYHHELSSLNAAGSQDKREIAKQLVATFGIKIREDKLQETLYCIEFYYEHINKLKEFQKLVDHEYQTVIKTHCSGYDSFLKIMLDDPENMAKIKSSLKYISENYLEIFKYHLDSFYVEFSKKAPLVIYVALTVPKLRTSFFQSDFIKSRLNQLVNVDVENLYFLEEYLYPEEYEEYQDEYEEYQDEDIEVSAKPFKIGKYAKTFQGDTEGYWKDIEPKGKRFMIIAMMEGNFVRRSGKNGEELSATDINGQFPILDGIDYKSNYPAHKLIYLEV